MNSIEQIVRQLTGIDSRSDGHISRMERERSYILEIWIRFRVYSEISRQDRNL